MKLTSKVFEHQKDIPSKHTCEGQDVSPPLSWTDLPEKTKSLVLIVEDPDAPDPAQPKMVWDHWLLYNIPPGQQGLQEAVKPSDLPKEVRHAKNSWGRTGYGGPCPPIGKHRYFHKLYALDTVLPDLGTPDKQKLLQAIDGHVLTQTELVGTYQKKNVP